MERLHVARDSQLFPNLTIGILKFAGHFDRELVEQCRQLLEQRHRLLGAVLDPEQNCWKHSGDQRVQLVWVDRAYSQDDFCCGKTDLTQPSNAVVYFFEAETETTMLVNVNHAQVDGLGGTQIMSEMLVIYANLCNGEAADKGLRRLAHESLLRRNRLGLFKKGFWRRLHVQWIPVYGAIKFSLARVATLLGPAAKPASQPPGTLPCFAVRDLDPVLYRAAQERASAHDSTANNVMVAATFRAVDHWQRKHGITRDPGNSIRIMLPVNMRDYDDRRCGACNRVAFVQIDRRGKVLDDPQGLIWSVNYEFGVIRKFKFEKSMLIILRLMSLIPGLLGRSGAQRKCRATTVFSNLGAPFKRVKLPRQNGEIVSGNVRLIDAIMIGPFYDLTPATFLFTSYAGRNSISISFDPRALTADEAEELLDDFVEQLGVLCETGKP